MMDLLYGIWDTIVWLAEPWILGSELVIIMSVAIPLVVLVGLLTGPTRRVYAYINTMYHEASHAIAATLTGRVATAIKLNMDTSGVTLSQGTHSRVILFAGYTGPPIIGTALAALLATGRVGIAATVLATVSIIVLLLSRSIWSLVVTIPTVALCSIPIYAETMTPTVIMVSAFTWVILVGSIQPVRNLKSVLGTGRSDPEALSAHFGLSPRTWIFLMQIVALPVAAAGILMSVYPAWLLLVPSS